ncbi:MAG: winged helix-turn-helix domain-containing protein [Candidatus Methanoglobus sp.]
MKSLLEERIEEIGKKLDEILGAVSILQQNLVQLNVIFEAMNRSVIERDLLSDISAGMEEGLKKFRQESPSECEVRDFCMRRLEKAAMKILQTIAKKGAEEGLKELRMHVEALKKHSDGCKDENCLKNAFEVFKLLEKLIENSERTCEKRRELIQGLSAERLKEEEIAEKISAVSNAVRIKILKALFRGEKSYAELERITGLRGGHLQFHIKNLIKAGYAARGFRGDYVITTDGLRILKLISDLQD